MINSRDIGWRTVIKGCAYQESMKHQLLKVCAHCTRADSEKRDRMCPTLPYIKTLRHHGPYNSGTKRFGAPGLSKDKMKAKGRAFRTGIRQLFKMLINGKLTR